MRRRTRTVQAADLLPWILSAAVLVGTTTSAVAQTSAPTNFRPPVRTFDVFLGQNKSGPYSLSWKNIRTERDDVFDVYLDGTLLPRTRYRVDGKKGEVKFDTDLKTTSVVRVEYTYDPPVARRGGSSPFPLSASLYQIGDTALNVTILPGSEKSGNPLLVWGLGQKARLLGGGLTTNLYLSPDAQTASNTNLTDRAGLSLGYVWGGERAGITAGFARAGRGFSPDAGKMFDLADPTQRMTFGLHSRIADWLGVTGDMAEVRDLTGKGAQNSHGIGLTLGMSPRRPTLAYNRSNDIATDTSGAAIKTTTDKINLAVPVNGQTQITTKAQRSTVDNGDKTRQTAQDVAVGLATGSKDKKQQLTVNVSGGSKDTASATITNQNVDVTVQPRTGLTISAGTGTQTQTTQDTSATVGAAITHTETAKAEITALSGVKISGGLQKNTALANTTTVSDVGGEATLGKLDVATGYTNRGSTNRDTTQGGSAALDSTRARLALRPLGNLTLSGGLTINPNDTQGNAFEATRQEYGVTTRVGFFEVGSGYALTTRAAGASVPGGSAPQFGELNVNVGLHFNRQTNLIGNYKDSFLYGASVPGGLRTYGLGLTHTLGGLDFSLGGTMTEDRTQTGKPADVKAEAKLGIKF